MFSPALDDAIFGSNIMEQEIPMGWNVLLASALGISNVPPLITVPSGAVTMVGTWQIAQPILVKIISQSFAASISA